MLTREDFTVMSEGVFVPLAGTVKRCPRCARNGVDAGPGGTEGSTFIHVQTCEVIADGMRVDFPDCCVAFLPDLPRSLSLVACV